MWTERANIYLYCKNFPDGNAATVTRFFWLRWVPIQCAVPCYLSPSACNLLSASPLIAPINLSRPVVINSTPGLAFLCLEIPIPNKWISSSVDDLLGGKLSGLDQIGGEVDLLSCLDSAMRLVRLIDGANKHSQILGTGGGGGNLGNALNKENILFYMLCSLGDGWTFKHCQRHNGPRVLTL